MTVSVFDNVCVCVCVSNQLCEENTPTSLSYLPPPSSSSSSLDWPPRGRTGRAAIGRRSEEAAVCCCCYDPVARFPAVARKRVMHYGWLDFSRRSESEMLMTGLSLIGPSLSLSITLSHALLSSLSLSLSPSFSLHHSDAPSLLSPIQICFNGQSRLYKVSHSAGIDITGRGGFFKIFALSVCN